MKHLTFPMALAATLLAACGADVATATATTGKLQAQAAEEAKAQQARIKGQLDEAMKASGAARAEAAGQ